MTIKPSREVSGWEAVFVFIVNAILFILFSALVGALGYWVLDDVFRLGYGTWWGITIFGSAVVSLGVNRGVSN